MQIIRDDDVERLKKQLSYARNLLKKALESDDAQVKRVLINLADINIMAILSYIGGDQEDE